MRTSNIQRNTKETKINIELNLDGGEVEVSTGIGFFDHMLTAFGVHGGFGLRVEVKGDLEVDTHHTAEDTGIVLGEVIKKALGDKKGIKRFGYFILPMDESLVLASLDLSGRPFLNYQIPLSVERVGTMDTEMVREFFYAVS